MPRGVLGVVNVIVCRRNASQCCVCGRGLWKNWKLCDFPIAQLKTCDRPLCKQCAVHVDPDLDYCPAHARLKGLDQQRTGSMVSRTIP